MTEEALTPDTGVAAVDQTQPDAPQAEAPLIPAGDEPAEVQGRAPRNQRETIVRALRREGLMEKAPAEPKEAAPPAEAPKGEDPDRTKADAKSAEAAGSKPAEPKLPEPKARVAAPFGFNAAAQAEWDKVPEPVQHEVARRIAETERGLADYRASTEPLKPFLEQAKASGVDPGAAIQSYMAAERALHDNPAQALAQLAQSYMPGGVEALLAQWTGQQPQPPSDQSAAQIAALTRQVQELTAYAAQQQEAASARAAADTDTMARRFQTENPRAAEPAVEAEMIRLLQTGYVPHDLPAQDRLSQAYAAATRLIPATQPEPAPPAPAQTREATSISGSPRAGSYPSTPRPATQRDSVVAAVRRFAADI